MSDFKKETKEYLLSADFKDADQPKTFW